MTVGAVESHRVVGLGPPVADGCFDVFPLLVLLLCTEHQSQSLDGFGVYGAGAGEPSANSVGVCAREVLFDISRH